LKLKETKEIQRFRGVPCLSEFQVLQVKLKRKKKNELFPSENPRLVLFKVQIKDHGRSFFRTWVL